MFILFGVGTNDPWVFAGSTVALFAIAVLAAVVPGIRAARLDPMTALRHE